MKYIFAGLMLSFFIFSSQAVLAEKETESLKKAEQHQIKIKADDGSIPTQGMIPENQKAVVDAIPEAEEDADSKSNRDTQFKVNEPIRQVYDQI